jgi:hypothetical protein
MKKPVILIVLILVAAVAAIVFWRHYRQGRFTQAQLITHNGKRPLSKAELDVVNKQTQYFNTNTNHPMPGSLPQDVRRNMDTINEIQRINQLNKRQSQVKQ